MRVECLSEYYFSFYQAPSMLKDSKLCYIRLTNSLKNLQSLYRWGVD